MTKRIKISDLPEFDAAEYLNSEEDIAAYLTTVIEENDPALLAAALGDIADIEFEPPCVIIETRLADFS